MNEATTRADVRNALFKYLDTDTIWYSTLLLTNYTHSSDTRGIAFTRTIPSPLCVSKRTTGIPCSPGRVIPSTSSFSPPTLYYSMLSQKRRKRGSTKCFRVLIPGKWPVAYQFIVQSHRSCKYVLWTAMERVTFTTKSFLIALALVHGRINAEQAALASQVEVASQIERWGEVEDCTFVHLSVPPTRPTSDTQLTTLTIMTCEGTSGAQPV